MRSNWHRYSQIERKRGNKGIERKQEKWRKQGETVHKKTMYKRILCRIIKNIV